MFWVSFGDSRKATGACFFDWRRVGESIIWLSVWSFTGVMILVSTFRIPYFLLSSRLTVSAFCKLKLRRLLSAFFGGSSTNSTLGAL